MSKYLKDRQHYYDEYDRCTIEQCKEHLERMAGKPDPKKELTEDQQTIHKWLSVWAELHIYFIKGERYRDRESTVAEMFGADQRRDDTLANAVIPDRVICKNCGAKMEFTQKDLDIYDESRVLIMFNCPKCGKGRAIYDNGDEWKYTPPNCSKCGRPYTYSSTKVYNKIITTYVCSKCNNTEETVLNLDEKYIPHVPDLLSDEDTKLYLMDTVEGAEYIDSCFRLQDATDAIKEAQEREQHKEIYDKVAKVKRLRIAEVEKLLTDIANENDYTKFQFGKPDTGRYFTVEFSAEDIKPNREEYDSKHMLLKTFEKALNDTNWRVMSDGIYYRVGYLTGRVRCYEKEEEVLELIKHAKDRKK